MRALTIWMAAISGSVNTTVHSTAKPNCAPAWEYVAMPLGSSSAAPVIRPGPSCRRRRAKREAAVGRSTARSARQEACRAYSRSAKARGVDRIEAQNRPATRGRASSLRRWRPPAAVTAGRPQKKTREGERRMALLQLTEEQIRTWTRAQKDEWWFRNVYRGDMAQLTFRSAVTGFVLGGVLAATAMYIGAKTGISIGVGLTSVILAFAMYRIMASAGLAKDFTILENNCTQSIATAAGYMISPMISSLAAYMLVTGNIIPWWHMIVWMCVVSLIGVLLAFPMKRRFINEEQLPFPEGRASGVVLDALYTGAASEGMFKARLLGVTALVTGAYQAIISDGWMKLLQFKLLRMDQWAGMKEPWVLHERLDAYYYATVTKASGWIPTILGTDIRQLGLRLTLDAAMLGVGGLMGMAIATSCLLGAFINFVVLAPLMIQAGDI